MYNNVPLDESGLTACIGRIVGLFMQWPTPESCDDLKHVIVHRALETKNKRILVSKRVSSIYQWVNPTTFPDTQNLHHP